MRARDFETSFVEDYSVQVGFVICQHEWAQADNTDEGVECMDEEQLRLIYGTYLEIEIFKLEHFIEIDQVDTSADSPLKSVFTYVGTGDISLG